MQTDKHSRRNFIKKAAAGAMGIATLSARSYDNILGANDRINIGIVGLNGRGQGHIRAVSNIRNVTIRALCDVDSRVLTKSVETVNKWTGATPKTFGDIRKLLKEKDLDAITIATPDHWHTPMAMMAMQAGKHVYLEKPGTFNAQEGEWLVQSKYKYGKVLQIGNQQRSAPTSIQGIEDIKNGIIGDVYFGKAWYANTRGTIGAGKKVMVPKWLDWEMWQGPSPRTDYKDNIVHYNWHWFWNWGTGEINNNGLHEIDICRWALGVDYPIRITSSGGRYSYKDDWQFYDTQVASFEFEKNKMITWEGRSCNGFAYFERGRGATIHGKEGTVLLDRNGYSAYNKKGELIKQMLEKEQSATTDKVGVGALDLIHMRNFVGAILNGDKLNSPVEKAVISNLMCHLGNISQKYERTLNLDNHTGKILNDSEAMKLWGRRYERGWKPSV